jgi:hypothetical protein
LWWWCSCLLHVTGQLASFFFPDDWESWNVLGIQGYIWEHDFWIALRQFLFIFPNIWQIHFQDLVICQRLITFGRTFSFSNSISLPLKIWLWNVLLCAIKRQKETYQSQEAVDCKVLLTFTDINLKKSVHFRIHKM